MMDEADLAAHCEQLTAEADALEKACRAAGLDVPERPKLNRTCESRTYTFEQSMRSASGSLTPKDREEIEKSRATMTMPDHIPYADEMEPHLARLRVALKMAQTKVASPKSQAPNATTPAPASAPNFQRRPLTFTDKARAAIAAQKATSPAPARDQSPAPAQVKVSARAPWTEKARAAIAAKPASK